MFVLITGSNGFLGSNLRKQLELDPELTVLLHNRNHTTSELREKVHRCSIIFHFAGVNRTQNSREFMTVNAGLTEEICHFSSESALAGDQPRTIIYSSSTQATLDNEYGHSKLEAERVIAKYTSQGLIGSSVFRLPGVFGPGARPNYNSVVATFCDSIAKGIEPRIYDENRNLKLVYIDDVVKSMNSIREIDPGVQLIMSVGPEFEISVGDLYKLLLSLENEFHLGKLPHEDQGTLKAKLALTLFHYLK